MTTSLQEILKNGSLAEKKALFTFSSKDDERTVLLKFDLWGRYSLPQYFESPDAPFHTEINRNNLKAYRGELDAFVDCAFRGAGKDVKTKLFIPFCILNDREHSRKYFKVLSADLTNARQAVTDMYNMLVNPRILQLYPDTLQKTQYKREEQMGSFTTSTGIKVISDTVGTEQRGAIQEANRPDFVWVNDFETRKTLRSAVITRSIWDNIEEARTGLQKGGAMVYTCFGRETRFVTALGVRAFSDFEDGDTTTVLTHNGVWKRATVRNFGRQELQRVEFSRGKRGGMHVWATKDHNWILSDGTRTNNLKTGDKLLGAPNIFDDFVYEDAKPMEKLYWCYGYVFGDGTRVKSHGAYKYSMVRLFGRDVRFKDRFEEMGFKTSTNDSLNGDFFAYTGTYLKELPDPGKDSPELIRAFVRGFLDADGAKGDKSKRYSSPFVQMVQTDKHNALDFIRSCFPIAGVFITYEKQIGGVENISPYDGRVMTRHETSRRFGLGSNFRGSNHNIQFKATVTDETRMDDVWCLVVEDDHSFVLESGISTGNCNYISELGNVHRLINDKLSIRKKVLIVPIRDAEGKPAWSRYTVEDIAEMERTDDDFEGERMCKPSSSKDVLFDRESLDKMEVLQPKRVIAGFKVYKDYDPSHRYGSGHDVAGGVGLDSSTSVFIDFDTVPAQVVATFASNTVIPEVFGAEIYNESSMYGLPIMAPENNKFDQTILAARRLGANLYTTQPKDTKLEYTKPTSYGWSTNSLTKPKMLFSFAKAIRDGLIALNDPDLIAEAKGFSRNDLMDREVDPRLTTRHFDLLTAACIAFQMKDFAAVARSGGPRVRIND